MHSVPSSHPSNSSRHGSVSLVVPVASVVVGSEPDVRLVVGLSVADVDGSVRDRSESEVAPLEELVVVGMTSEGGSVAEVRSSEAVIPLLPSATHSSTETRSQPNTSTSHAESKKRTKRKNADQDQS